MRTRTRVLTFALSAALSLFWMGAPLDSASPRNGDPVIRGRYMEVRARHWRGRPLQSETRLSGEHAVLAWTVEKGKWNGVVLDGLSMLAVVGSDGELPAPVEESGEPSGSPGAAGRARIRTVLYVDRRSSAEAERALIALGAELIPRYMKRLVKIRKAQIVHREEKLAASLEMDERILLEANAVAPREDRHHGPDFDSDPRGEDHQLCGSICGGRDRVPAALSRHTRVSCARAMGRLLRPSGACLAFDGAHPPRVLLGSFSL